MTLPRLQFHVMAVIVITIAGLAPTRLRLAKYVSEDSADISAYVLVALNLGIARSGVLTKSRWAWAAYLMASIVCFVLIGAVTPLSALWTLMRLLFNF